MLIESGAAPEPRTKKWSAISSFRLAFVLVFNLTTTTTKLLLLLGVVLTLIEK